MGTPGFEGGRKLISVAAYGPVRNPGDDLHHQGKLWKGNLWGIYGGKEWGRYAPILHNGAY
jgi:hypothetical protein